MELSEARAIPSWRAALPRGRGAAEAAPSKHGGTIRVRTTAWLVSATLALGAWSCGGSAGQTAPPADGICRFGAEPPKTPCTDIGGCPMGGTCFAGVVLNPDEVTAIMNLAASALDQDMVVAVTDRRGVVLGVGTNFPFDYDAECNTGVCPAVETGCPPMATRREMSGLA